MVVCFGYASSQTPVPSVAHVVVEHRYDVDAVLLAEDAADLLAQAFGVGVEASSELWWHVGVQVKVPVLVRLANELKVGSSVDNSLDTVFNGRYHHVVVAAGAYVEREFAVFSENGQVYDGVATFGCCYNGFKVVGTDLTEVAFKLFAWRIDVGKDDVVSVLERPDYPRAQHSASAEYENFHFVFPMIGRLGQKPSSSEAFAVM